MPQVSQQSPQRLFSRYNSFLYGQQLERCAVIVNRLDDLNGLCERAYRRITIDLKAHRDAADARATLIHEMIHLVTFDNHGANFWSEGRRLRQYAMWGAVSAPERPDQSRPMVVRSSFAQSKHRARGTPRDCNDTVSSRHLPASSGSPPHPLWRPTVSRPRLNSKLGSQIVRFPNRFG